MTVLKIGYYFPRKHKKLKEDETTFLEGLSNYISDGFLRNSGAKRSFDSKAKFERPKILSTFKEYLKSAFWVEESPPQGTSIDKQFILLFVLQPLPILVRVIKFDENGSQSGY